MTAHHEEREAHEGVNMEFDVHIPSFIPSWLKTTTPTNHVNNKKTLI